VEVIKENNRIIKLFVDSMDMVEESAIVQLKNIAKLPYIFKHVAVMPDVHMGKGATVGSVIASKGAISPAAVGVDIGCGMLAVPLEKNINHIGKLSDIRCKIENIVPLGHKGHEREQNLTGLESLASERVKEVWYKAPYQLGTLGGGNHFIEICKDKKDDAWLMLHSGSRNVGLQVAQVHIKRAKELMDIWQISLEDPDLAYLAQGVREFDEYMEDLAWCQDYAYLNRQSMLKNIMNGLGFKYDTKKVVNCHHNYVSTENHFGKNVFITRKGAVRAREGDLGIIPGAMGKKSFIVEGKGNKDSFCSCSHGAGRVMSRTEAKKRFSVADLKDQTDGVECRKDEGVIDEIPAAYKDIDKVMNSQKDLVEIKHELQAVLTVKG
jgi:tRNA-splicing ligase RtcB (3'-phosphate/5'-hydroxy nucleic acid ligase)